MWRKMDLMRKIFVSQEILDKTCEKTNVNAHNCKSNQTNCDSTFKETMLFVNLMLIHLSLSHISNTESTLGTVFSDSNETDIYCNLFCVIKVW